MAAGYVAFLSPAAHLFNIIFWVSFYQM